MSSNKKDDIISEASSHTIKKFELIEAYAKDWARKLLEYGFRTDKCDGIVYIDCMCNSGIYRNKETGEIVEGSPIRVARALDNIMHEANYQNKHAWLYFNDYSRAKIDELKKHLPPNNHNFHIQTSTLDGNDLISTIGEWIRKGIRINYLLVYDPYEASIDWRALLPFIRNWGEVILNHMVYDTVRALSQVKKTGKIIKYEKTYLSDIDDIKEYGNDKSAYEERVKSIIKDIKGNTGGSYYVASFPFYNKNNSLIYNLIHCTSNIEGFKLFKRVAWKVFGGKSSTKKPKNLPGQIQMSFQDNGELEYVTATDENCFCVSDIADYVEKVFKGKKEVPLNEIWDTVDKHPVFPSDPYKNDIKRLLRERGYIIHTNNIDFI